MAGLLGDVLPWMYSQSNTIKKNVKGLLNDPAAFVGSLGQDIQTQNDQRKADYRTLMEPGVFTSEAEKSAAINRAAQEAVNYAAPTVWHGSPHKFDKFDSSKIGTGEGAQAYGHGLYFAEAPEVAASYQRKLSGILGSPSNTVAVDGSALSGLTDGQRRAYEIIARDGRRNALETARRLKSEGLDSSDLDAALKATKGRKVSLDQSEGALYKVDLPDSAVAKMLDWDKPLSQQAPEVAAKVKKALDGKYGAGTFDEFSKNGGDLRDLVQNFDDLGRGGMESMFMAQGIPGIRYLDQGSRGTGTGTRNYVVFPGEEGLLNILERNGQPVGGLLK